MTQSSYDSESSSDDEIEQRNSPVEKQKSILITQNTHVKLTNSDKHESYQSERQESIVKLKVPNLDLYQ